MKQVQGKNEKISKNKKEKKDKKENTTAKKENSASANLTKEWLADTGEKLRFTFIDSDSHKDFKPIAQCYGVCFNEKGEIAIGRNPRVFRGNWILPGGRTEKGETPEQTLKRELLEELDLTVDKFKLIGAQRVESITDETKEPFYQLRYAVMIKEIKPLTLDPDNGALWERKFVKPKEVDEYLKWGKLLQHIVKKSAEWYEAEKSKEKPKTSAKNFLGKKVNVKMDRPLGSKHPKWDMIYPVNYGYIENTSSGDGEELDAYVLGVDKPVNEFTGICIAIIHRTNDDDDKLIVVPEGKNYSDEQIKKMTEFQEKFFESEIIRK